MIPKATTTTSAAFRSRKVFRADLDDVENLSYGRGAKKQRGTGSRFTCHRLNREERRTFDRAKRDGFLAVRGTGYRKNRKGSPVWNTFRQRCDALARVCVVVEKTSDRDRVSIDFSTLRVRNDSPLVDLVLEFVFRSKHPGLYEALIASDSDEKGGCNTDTSIGVEEQENDGTDCNSILVENTTDRPIDWEVVKTKPIWGVVARLLVVSCDRETAKSIAKDAVELIDSARFIGLQADAEVTSEQMHVGATGTEESPETTTTSKPVTPTKICPENTTSTNTDARSSYFNGDDDDEDEIDWNDI
mmetsp:Transcript_9449/g.23192  ORF Transcript_9449/g.23192 Transcript_9449/m.23192 type:complete len:302 (+) Transcript_9449:136-1041(+)